MGSISKDYPEEKIHEVGNEGGAQVWQEIKGRQKRRPSTQREQHRQRYRDMDSMAYSGAV